MNPALSERKGAARVGPRSAHLLARPLAALQAVSFKGRLICAYRAASVVLTGAAYLILAPDGLLPYKLPVVCALTVTALLLAAFYVTHENDRRGLVAALAVETVGIALLLLPTGGMESPFLWYALNPALVAACTLPWWVCWADFGIFLGMAAASGPWLARLAPGAADLADYGDTALVLALAVLALQMMAVLLRRRDLMAERQAVAREQQRIAGEIHDSVCQRLFSIACSAHALAANLPVLPAEEAARELGVLEECAGAANRELRSCIYHLHSTGETGVLQAVDAYLREFAQMHGVTMETALEGDGVLEPNRAAAMQRILREACFNAVRHGRCGSLRVRLLVQDGGARLQVMDDGLGFTPETARKGLGLNGMGRTIKAVGGDVTIKSEPGRGTVVLATLPKKDREAMG